MYGIILYHGKISSRDFRIFKARILVNELDTLCIKVHDGPLKALSSEMDRPKLGSFERHLLKREVRRILEKSAPPTCCESPLKITRHLVQLLAIRVRIANSAQSSASGLLFTTYSYCIGNGAMNKFRICYQ